MALKYEQVAQEDLNVGTSRVYIGAPAGGKARATQLGIHTPAVGQRAWTKTWSPGAIAASGSATTTITVTDAAVGALVMASHDKILTSALTISAHVSAADTVKVVIANPTTASITPASGTLRVVVFDSIDQSTCVLPTLILDESTSGSLDAEGVLAVSASTFDDGSVNVAYWKIQQLSGETVIQESVGSTNPASAILLFGCDDVGVVLIRVLGWRQNPETNSDFLLCYDTATSFLTISDPLAVCSA